MLDAIVIGGGVNGAGVARDLALRGLKVALYERTDLGAGTTDASSGMIHGGLRYLLYDRETTRISCDDAGAIRKIAPHMTFRIPFLLPLFGEGRASRLKHEVVEAFFRAYDKFSPRKGGKPHLRLTREEALAIEPGLRPSLAGAVTMDEWGIDSFRLVLANALDAARHGAEVHNHTPVLELLFDGPGTGPARRVAGVVVRERSGGRREVRARLVVNAAGPWVPRIAAMAGCEVKLRPGKGIHLVIERRISNVGVIARAVDGRSIFVQPHENVTWIGTTDDDYYGDPGEIPIHHDEVEYLLEAAESVFPGIRAYRVLRAFAGVRPTLHEDGRYEDELSRRHDIVDHGSRDGVHGLLTIAGGKLAAYRLMCQEAADLGARLLGSDAKGRTHKEPLPGGEEAGIPSAADLAREWTIDRYTAARLIFRHGSLARRVLEEAKDGPGGGGRRLVCRTEPVTEAEVRWACRHEWVRTLDDLRRRTKWADGPCQGLDCLREGARVVGEELGWSPDEKDGAILEFLQARWQERRPVLRGRELAHEELMQQTLVGVEGYDRG